MKQIRFDFLKIISLSLFMMIFVGLVLFAACRQQPEDNHNTLASPSPVVTASSALSKTSEFAMLFVNVGKADAAIVRFGEATVLIDTGSKNSAPQLIAGLNLLGVTKIDALFLTHSHSDHIGGINALSANYAITMTYSPFFSEQTKNGEGKIIKKIEKLSLPHTELKAGQTISITPDVSFSVLGPLELNEDDDNDNSLVLRFTVKNTTFLFTGDMQFSEEDTLLHANVDLSADVLKVGNHGNPDATGEFFAAAVSPALAIISTDTSVDTDSANSYVISALSGANVLITEDFPLGVLLTLDADGNPVVSNPNIPAFASEVSIVALDPDSQTITIANNSNTQADLSGCILYSEHANAALRIPDGTLLPANDTLIIAGNDGNGDLRFSGEDKPLSKKKQNTVTLYSTFGLPVDSLHQ